MNALGLPFQLVLNGRQRVYGSSEQASRTDAMDDRAYVEKKRIVAGPESTTLAL